MVFGWGKGKEKPSKGKAAVAKESSEIDPRMMREAVLRSAGGVAPEVASPASQEIPEGTEQMGILILPDQHDVMEFWMLYQRISQSDLRSHIGVFKRSNGLWTEQKPSE